MEKKSLEQALIDALSRLQYADVDKALIADTERLGAEQPFEQHFAFAIGQRQFAVRADCFCEVFSELPVASLPNAPSLLAGLCNVRGVLVPVYQLHSEWGIVPPQKTFIFCVGKGEKSVALLIDGLPVSLDLGERDCVEDETLHRDAVLSSLVEKTFLSSGLTRYRLDGEALGAQLFLLANLRQRERTQTGTSHPVHDSFTTHVFPV